VKKCPAVKQLDRFEHLLYHSKGINAGSDDDTDDLCSDATENIYPVKVSAGTYTVHKNDISG
jgi:hypothetical protein